MHIVAFYYKHIRLKNNIKKGLWMNVKHHIKAILLLKVHLLDAKNSIDVVSSTWHP
jgi:hypothetical protein